MESYASAQATLLERWDGMTWTRARPPNLVAKTALTGIADFDGEAIAVRFAREPNGGPGLPSQPIAFEAQCLPERKLNSPNIRLI